MWDGVRKAFHILIIHDSFFPVSCVYSPPDRPLEKKELGLVAVSPSVSVALVSALATVSVHFCLCRVGLHTCQCPSTSVSAALVSTLATVSVRFCLCRVGLHTCHSVSPLLSLPRWSPHLPLTVSVHSVLKRLSHCPCGYTDGTTE